MEILHRKSADNLEIYHGDQIALYNVDTQQGITVLQQGWGDVFTQFLPFGNQEKMNFTQFESLLFDDTKISQNIHKLFATHTIYKTNNQSGAINHGDVVEFELTPQFAGATSFQMHSFLHCDMSKKMCMYQNAPSANKFMILTDDKQPLKHDSSFQIKCVHNISGNVSTSSDLVVEPSNNIVQVAITSTSVNKWKVGITGDTMSDIVGSEYNWIHQMINTKTSTEIAKMETKHKATVNKMKDKLESKTEQSMQYQTKLDEERQKNSQLRHQLNELSKHSYNQFYETVNKMKDELQSKTEEIDKEQQKNSQLREELSSLNQSSIHSYNQLFKIANELKDDLLLKTEESEQCHQENSKLKQQLSSLNRSNVHLQKQLVKDSNHIQQNSTGANYNLSETLQQITMLQNVNRTLRQNIVDMEMIIEQQNITIQEEHDRYKQCISNLNITNNSLIQLQKNLTHLKQKSVHMNAQSKKNVSNLTMQMGILVAAKQQLQKEKMDILHEKNSIQTKYENDNQRLQTTVYCLLATTVALIVFFIINLGLLRKKWVWPMVSNSQKTDTSNKSLQLGEHKNEIENDQQLQYDENIKVEENVQRLSLHTMMYHETDENEDLNYELDQQFQKIQNMELCGIVTNAEPSTSKDCLSVSSQSQIR